MPNFNRIFIIIALVVFISVGYFIFSLNRSGLYSLKIEGKNYSLMTAKTTTEWTKGLMDYKSKSELKGADGMIFIFPKKEYKQFWNQNTYLDLKIYWMVGDRIIGQSDLPSITKSKDVVVVYSPEKVDRVVEIVK